MGEAMNKVISSSDLFAGTTAVGQAPVRFQLPLGDLPDAPLLMPKQVLERPIGVMAQIRAAFSRPLGRAET